MKTTLTAVLVLAVTTAAVPAVAAVGALDEVPAATLLVPYFEVDLSPTYDGPVTIFSIGNASATAVLAHVTLWTDRAVPTHAFDIYLTGYDLEFVDLRLLFDGITPVTADAGADPSDVVGPHGAFSQDINFPGDLAAVRRAPTPACRRPTSRRYAPPTPARRRRCWAASAAPRTTATKSPAAS